MMAHRPKVVKALIVSISWGLGLAGNWAYSVATV